MPYIVYGLLAIAVLGPLLLPGYALTLDMVFVPHPPLPQELSNTYVFEALLHFASYIIAGDILQKIVLFAVLLLAGLGAHRLLQSFDKALPAWSLYVAGIFYMVNPFIYGRFMAGQYLVLFGYALLPFFVRALLRFLQKPRWQNALIAAGWLVGISLVSIHTIGIAMAVAVVATAAALWQWRANRTHVLAIAAWAAFGIGVFVFASCYWLVPMALGQGSAAHMVQQFDSSDTDAFATDGGLPAVLMLRGFWAEAQGLFMTVDSVLPMSGLLQLGVWALVAIGTVKLWRAKPWLAVVLGVVTLIATVLALLPLGNLPLLAGYREPHKFVALVALAFALFFALGAAAIVQKIEDRDWQWLTGAAMSLAFLLPFLTTPTFLWGGYGQLSARQYPADWYQINDKLNQEAGDSKTLFLPWHLYMKFNFADRVIANPAKKFFDKPVVVSDNVEFAGIADHTISETKQKLERDILPHAADQTTLGAQLAPLGIRYVLFAKESDAADYAYLDRQTDVQMVLETTNFKLYQVTGGNSAGN